MMNGVAMPSPNTNRRSARPTITVTSHVMMIERRSNGFVQLRDTGQLATSAIRKGAAVLRTPEIDDPSS